MFLFSSKKEKNDYYFEFTWHVPDCLDFAHNSLEIICCIVFLIIKLVFVGWQHSIKSAQSYNWNDNQTFDEFAKLARISKNYMKCYMLSNYWEGWKKRAKYLYELNVKRNIWNNTWKKEYSKEYWEGWKKRAKIFGWTNW